METTETLELAEAVVCRGEYSKVWECVAQQPELREPGSALWRLTRQRLEGKASEYEAAMAAAKAPGKRLAEDAYSQISYAYRELLSFPGGGNGRASAARAGQEQAARAFLRTLIDVVKSKPHLMDYTAANEDFGALRGVLQAFYSHTFLVNNAAVKSTATRPRSSAGEGSRWKKRRLRELFLDINVDAVRAGHEAMFRRNAGVGVGAGTGAGTGTQAMRAMQSRLKTQRPLRPGRHPGAPQRSRLRGEQARVVGKLESTPFPALTDAARFFQECAIRYAIGEQVRNSLKASTIPLDYLQELVADIAAKNELERLPAQPADEAIAVASVGSLTDEIIRAAAPANRNRLSMTLARSDDRRFRLAVVPWRTFLRDYIVRFCVIHGIRVPEHQAAMLRWTEQQVLTAALRRRQPGRASNSRAPQPRTEQAATSIYGLNRLLYAVAIYRTDRATEPREAADFETLMLDDALLTRWEKQAAYFERSGMPADKAIADFMAKVPDSFVPPLSIGDLAEQYLRFIRDSDAARDTSPRIDMEAARIALMRRGLR